MEITPLIPAGRQIIQSYGGGRFRVSGQVHEQAVIVFPTSIIKWNYAGNAADLKAEDFAEVIAQAHEIDVMLLGCGAKMELLPELKKALKAQGLNIDSMDTGAACRTYNVLMAEGRRIAAALLPVL